jgi:hypothetical protein
MSQLKNTTTIFQNNDLVTAAKLNSLVTDTSLDKDAVFSQPPASNALEGTDLILGYEAATDSLVAISIDKVRGVGSSLSPLKAQSIEPIEQGQMSISQNQTNSNLKIETVGGGGLVLEAASNGSVSIFSGLNSRTNLTKTEIASGPFEVKENMDVLGQSRVANLSSIVGSPIITFTFTGNHGLLSNMPIEITGPTAEFSGLFESFSVTGLNTINITLPANATVAHTSTAVTVRRVSFRVRELSYLSRLRVMGVAEFRSLCNFLLPPTLNNAAIKPRYDYFVQTRAQAVLTSGWGGVQNTANLNGTKITQLDITFTPQKAGNTVVLDWAIHGEAWNGEADMAFVVTRTPNSGTGAGVAVALPDSVDASNNTWSGVTGGTYDTNEGTTPSTRRIKIVDFNTLAVSCTYSVHFRAANNRTVTFHLNRSAATAGSIDNETGLSVGHAHEIYV